MTLCQTCLTGERSEDLAGQEGVGQARRQSGRRVRLDIILLESQPGA